MKELKCPKCGNVFSVDDADYASIVSQVRNNEFMEELDRRLAELRKEMQAQKEADEAKSANAQIIALGKKDQELLKKDTEIASLKSKLDGMEKEGRLSLAEALAAKDKEIAGLKAAAKANEGAVRIAVLEQQQAAQEKLNSKDAEIAKLKTQAELDKSTAELRERTLKEQHANELKAKDEEVAFYKDFKARKSTKEIGESLEQYCYKLYSQTLRPVMPNATFDKDNDASEGSKGDFIFRDSEDGTEYISIMYEMKNENEETAVKHKNSDFFLKLDKDRKQKGCEYAILVSMLEMDSDLYNDGIVVVPGFEKMYVVRPENFIPLTTLLVQTSKKALEFKKELVEARKRNVDVTGFEDKLHELQKAASDHYDTAEKYFEKVIADIDATIKKLEDMKKNLTTTGNQLRLANNSVQEITVRKLTYQNATMKQKFEEARSAASISAPANPDEQ